MPNSSPIASAVEDVSCGAAASTAEPVLAAQGLVKRFGSLRALDDVSFKVKPGEVVGVVGPNGAGKTTLFGALAGSFPVSEGQIEFEGAPITYASAEERCRLGIARTYQVPRPFLGMTVFENVLVAARAGGGVPRVEAIDLVADVLEQTGLMPLANTPALATGLLDRKRLEVARALATKPKVILVDEIGGGLTEAELVQLIKLVGGLKAQGMTVVWIEHILHALLQVIERLVCMAEGRVLAQGDPKAVMENAEVRAAYLGRSPE